jgi:hypothetical protein
MNDLSVQGFEKVHGTPSYLSDRVRVKEIFEGETVFEGDALVFELWDHPSASRVLRLCGDGHAE